MIKQSTGADILRYKNARSDFPDETTIDQFFDEKQFEAYREPGYRPGAKLDELSSFSEKQGVKRNKGSKQGVKYHIDSLFD